MSNEHCGKILVAEDDRFITQIYATKLGKAGFELVMVSDGRDVVPHMLREKPDLVLLDLMMPGKSGFDVLRDIKADPELKKIPVLVITALAQTKERELGLQLGAKDYIIKSDHSIQEIIAKITRYCDQCGITRKA
ncbi:MAG TPA: response regulator [Patescibacteria group bacterium]|nr:response regulator [Patescibacteria group bacterium]